MPPFSSRPITNEISLRTYESLEMRTVTSVSSLAAGGFSASLLALVSVVVTAGASSLTSEVVVVGAWVWLLSSAALLGDDDKVVDGSSVFILDEKGLMIFCFFIQIGLLKT